MAEIKSAGVPWILLCTTSASGHESQQNEAPIQKLQAHRAHAFYTCKKCRQFGRNTHGKSWPFVTHHQAFHASKLDQHHQKWHGHPRNCGHNGPLAQQRSHSQRSPSQSGGKPLRFAPMLPCVKKYDQQQVKRIINLPCHSAGGVKTFAWKNPKPQALSICEDGWKLLVLHWHAWLAWDACFFVSENLRFLHNSR